MENGRIVKSMEKDYINLAIKTIMKGSLCKGWGLVKAYINGPTVAFTMDNGKQIRWMEEGYIEEWMDQSQKEYSRTII